VGTWTITTTADEDAAITWANQQSQRALIGSPAPPVAKTDAAFFQQSVQQSTLDPLSQRYRDAQSTELIATLNTIPPANRPAARIDIETAIEAHGGTAPLHQATYFWSTSTAPPPRVQSVEVDATEANFSTVMKIYFDDLDTANVSHMTDLLALKLGTIIRLVDPANAANLLEVVTIATPIQRQGADGHVEIAVRFNQKSGTLLPLDTHPLTCTFA
jgi:hypothetical protein